MKKIFVIIIIVAVGWYGNYKFERYSNKRQLAMSESAMDTRIVSNTGLRGIGIVSPDYD